MPTVNLSPVFNGWQAFGVDGLPLSGGLLYTYQAGTSTPQATYTTSAGSSANTNPIVCGPDGRPPQEIWLVQGQSYRFVLQTTLAAQIATYDNISGVNDQTAPTAALVAYENAVAASSGSTLIGFIAAGTGAVLQTMQDKLRSMHSSVTDFGAGITGFPQSMTNGGSAYRVPPGSYVYTVSLVADYSNVAFPDWLTPSTRISLRGDAMHSTFLRFNGAAAAYALVLTGPASMANLGSYSQSLFDNFVLQDSGRTRTRNGISLTNVAYTELRRLQIDGFNNGLYVNSSLSSKFDNVSFTLNAIGTVIDSTTLQALPNALSWDNCDWNGNINDAIVGNIAGATQRFTSCRFEQNGIQGTGGNGGVFLNINATNGIASVVFESCYFEGNGGVADVSLTNVSAGPVSVVFINCTFNRISSAKYVTNNIVGVNSGGGSMDITLIGCGFLSSGTYVPNAGRAFLAAGDTKTRFVDGGGNSYSENTSRTIGLGSSPMTGGRVVGATGGAVSLPNHITSSRSATGTYKLTSTVPFGVSTSDYLAQFSFINGGVNAQAKWTPTSTTVIDLVVYNVLTGAAIDCDFAFSIQAIK